MFFGLKGNYTVKILLIKLTPICFNGKKEYS